MRSAAVLVPEVGRATGPDLTRYLVVCAGSILLLLVLAWLFRRFVAGRLTARAAKRSLQVLDVLPLSGKQKLVVVRCYDRSFLLAQGEKEVRAIAELETAALPRRPSEALPPPGPPFSAALSDQLTSEHITAELVLQPVPQARPTLGTKEGLLA